MTRLITLLAALFCAPQPVLAMNCSDRTDLISKLALVGEEQTGLGLSSQGEVIEIWTSDTTGTWTIVLSHSNGLSCILSYGHDWTGPVTNMASLKGAPT